MNNQWRQEKRGDFGWSVEEAAEIKALWLAKAEFADPNKKVSGKISKSTSWLLVRKLAKHAADIKPHFNLAWGLCCGSLMAFTMADTLGGGFLIVLPDSPMNFQTIAIERISARTAAN